MNVKKWAVAAAIAATAFLSVPGISTASDAGDALATVHRAVTAYNNGDMKAWTATCGSPVSIIDDFPPYEWYGATACSDWWSALTAFNKRNGVTSSTVAPNSPWHAVVTGNRAYVVLPVTLHYNLMGKPVKETGSILTVMLKKTANGWLMAAWSYSQH